MNSAAVTRPGPAPAEHGVTALAKPRARYPVFSIMMSSSSSTEDGQVGAAITQRKHSKSTSVSDWFMTRSPIMAADRRKD